MSKIGPNVFVRGLVSNKAIRQYYFELSHPVPATLLGGVWV